MSIQDGLSASASTTLSSAVAGFIRGEWLPFALVESDLLARVIAACSCKEFTSMVVILKR